MGKYYSVEEISIYDEYVSIYRAIHDVNVGEYPLMVRSNEARLFDQYIKWRRKKAEKSS